MLSAIMGPKRLWECSTAPEKNNCTASEKKTARAWLIGGSIAAIVAALTAFGLIRGPEIVRQAKIQAIDKEIADIKATRVNAQTDLSPADFRQLGVREEDLRQKRSELTK